MLSFGEFGVKRRDIFCMQEACELLWPEVRLWQIVFFEK